MAALAWLELHPHAGDAALDGADNLFVPSEVSSDQAEIICIWQRDSGGCAVLSVKFVAIVFLHILQLKKHRRRRRRNAGNLFAQFAIFNLRGVPKTLAI